MFTLLGQPVGDIAIKVDPEESDPHKAVEAVFFINEKRELTDVGLRLFILENIAVLTEMCSEAHSTWLNLLTAPAPASATLH